MAETIEVRKSDLRKVLQACYGNHHRSNACKKSEERLYQSLKGEN